MPLMPGIAEGNPTLVIALQAAVPLWILDLASRDPADREPVRLGWVRDAVDAVASKGDVLQYGGRRSDAAKVFNALARGLAGAAFQPGGITFAGEHWCVNHTECVDAAPSPTPQELVDVGSTPLLRCYEPITADDQPPTYQGRPVVDIKPDGARL